MNRLDDHVHNVVFRYRGYVLSLRNDTPCEMLVWREAKPTQTVFSNKQMATAEGIAKTVRAIDRLLKKETAP
jgi:hypothetical protein